MGNFKCTYNKDDEPTLTSRTSIGSELIYYHAVRDPNGQLLNYKAFDQMQIQDPCTMANVEMDIKTIQRNDFFITQQTVESISPSFLMSFVMRFKDETYFNTTREIDVLEGTYLPCDAPSIYHTVFTPSLSVGTTIHETTGMITFAMEDIPGIGAAPITVQI